MGTHMVRRLFGGEYRLAKALRRQQRYKDLRSVERLPPLVEMTFEAPVLEV